MENNELGSFDDFIDEDKKNELDDLLEEKNEVEEHTENIEQKESQVNVMVSIGIKL